jgi:hypothetical protein
MKLYSANLAGQNLFMDYIVIPTKDKAETSFFVDLLKKMHKESTTLSSSKMEDRAFIATLKEAEASDKGSLKKVKAHLDKIIAG